MALSYPLSYADFFAKLPVTSVVFRPVDSHQITGLGGGDIHRAELAPTRWHGSCELPTMRSRDAARIETLLMGLTVPGRAFFASKLSQIGPASDPLGDAISGYSPKIAEVFEAQSQLRLNGLPPGYQLSSGDLVSFAYGVGPQRYALHRVIDDVTASGAGVSPAFGLLPHIRPDAVVGADVQLVRPFCKAVLLPGSVSYGTTRGGKTFGMGFEFRQSFR